MTILTSTFFDNALWVVIGLIAFALVMMVLVVVHEGGHFVAAKKAGILCYEFSIGMGPLIFQKRKGETLYSIRLFPIGGYVSMAGEEIEDNILKGVEKVKLVIKNDIVEKIIVNLDNPKYKDCPTYTLGKYDLIGTKDPKDDLFIEVLVDEEYQRFVVKRDCIVNHNKKDEIQIAPFDRNFVNKPLGKRFLSVFAGPLMNFVLAVVVFFFIGLFTGYPNTKSTVVGGVNALENSFNELQKGDEITHINGIEVNNWDELSNVFNEISKGGTSFTEKVVVKTKDNKIMTINPSILVYYCELVFDNDGTNKAIVGEYYSNNSQTKTYKAGLRKGDILTSVIAKDPKTDAIIDSISNETELTKSAVLEFFNRTTLESGPDIYFSYIRDGEVKTSEKIEAYDLKTLQSQGIPKAKVQIGIECENKFNFVKLLYMPWVQTGQSLTQIVKTLGLIFSKSRVGVKDLSGPIGIFSIIKSSIKEGTIFYWLATLSVNLGFINLLPLPALDGGRLTFMLYEGITKKKPNSKVENIIHTVGFVLLMILMVFITFNDITRCIGC